MIVTPGPYAAKVTQHMVKPEADWTADAYGNKVPAFSDRVVRVLAEYPTLALESDNASGDVITADRTLLLAPALVVSEFDEFTISDGLRYRVNGAPARYLHPHTGTAVTQVSLRRIS